MKLKGGKTLRFSKGGGFIGSVIFAITALFLFVSQSFAQTPTGKIAFVKFGEKNQNPNIWLVNADGSDPKQITTDNDSELPCWLGDGRLVVGRGHQQHPKYGIKKFPTEIWAMNADGSEAKLLVKTESPFQDLECSPKEAKIAYSQIDKESGRDIWLFEIGGTPKNLTNQPSNNYAVSSFSPDGKRILFSKFYRKDPSDDIHSALFSMDLSGSSDEQLLVDDPMEYYAGPVLSPAGDKLVFWRVSSRNVGIHDSQYLMKALADGSDAKRFRPDFGGADEGYARWDTSLPDFSLDGKELVFEVRANKLEPEATPETSIWEESLWVVPVDGGQATKIADEGTEPAWQKATAVAVTPSTQVSTEEPPPTSTEYYSTKNILERLVDRLPFLKPILQDRTGNIPTPAQAAKTAATSAAVGAIATAAYALIMRAQGKVIVGKPGPGRAGQLIKLGCYSLVVFGVAAVATGAALWKIQSSKDVVPPAKPEQPSEMEQPSETAQLSEQPDLAKFKEYFSELYLAKPPPGVEIPSYFEAIKTNTFSPSDRLCTLGNANKIIDTGRMATAIYDVTNKKYVKEKSPHNTIGPVPTGSFTEECKPITFPAGIYERKIYVNDVLVAVFPFEITK